MNKQVLASLPAAGALVWRYASSWTVLRVVLALAAGVVPVATAWLMKTVLDRITASGEPLLLPALLLAAAGAIAVVLPHGTRFTDAELQRNVGLGARERLYAAVDRQQGLAAFEDPNFHARMQLAADNGPGGPPAVMTSVLSMAQGALTLSGFLATLAWLNPWMLLVAIVAAVPALRAEMLLGRARAAMLWDLGHNTRREIFYANLLTDVTAAKEIRLYGLGALFGARMAAELRQINSEHRRLDRRELWVQVALGLCGALIAGGGLIWAVRAVQAGQLTVGDITVFVAAMAGVQGGLATIIGSTGDAHRALLLFSHYRQVVEAETDLLPAAQVSPVHQLRRGIELRDVWFRYADDLPWVLRGVDLTIPAGKSTALVGLNGAGKSTIVKLICRFYDPTRGSVSWDGIDLRELPVAELRRRLSAVFQDFMEYELSAAENIGVGDTTSLEDHDRLIVAAQRAGCHEALAALPRGYDTMLTRIYTDFADRNDPGTGVMLSGGQWQRVALARGLLRDRAEVLILDEPSAGLDADAEAAVYRQLRHFRAGRTSVLISHRLSAVRDADQIVVLADGRIAERGTHGELLAALGTYARLFRLQAEGYQERVRQA